MNTKILFSIILLAVVGLMVQPVSAEPTLLTPTGLFANSISGVYTASWEYETTDRTIKYAVFLELIPETPHRNHMGQIDKHHYSATAFQKHITFVEANMGEFFNVPGIVQVSVMAFNLHHYSAWTEPVAYYTFDWNP